MVEWFLGTMGFAYTDWEGTFYPVGLDTSKYLAYYSRYFNCVEIDSTFYGTPRRATVNKWYCETPSNFRFSLKVPQQVTHQRNPHTYKTELNLFLAAVSNLEEKLGVVLFQFPPDFDVTQRDFFVKLIGDLPLEFRYAIEFRHKSWFDRGEFPLCRERGICVVANDYPGLPMQIVSTANFLYLRWVGQHGKYPHHQFEREQMQGRLLQWKELIDNADVKEIFGYFNNDYAGCAVQTLKRFIQLLGKHTESEPHPEQGKLF